MGQATSTSGDSAGTTGSPVPAGVAAIDIPPASTAGAAGGHGSGSDSDTLRTLKKKFDDLRVDLLRDFTVQRLKSTRRELERVIQEHAEELTPVSARIDVMKNHCFMSVPVVVVNLANGYVMPSAERSTASAQPRPLEFLVPLVSGYYFQEKSEYSSIRPGLGVDKDVAQRWRDAEDLAPPEQERELDKLMHMLAFNNNEPHGALTERALVPYLVEGATKRRDALITALLRWNSSLPVVNAAQRRTASLDEALESGLYATLEELDAFRNITLDLFTDCVAMVFNGDRKEAMPGEWSRALWARRGNDMNSAHDKKKSKSDVKLSIEISPEGRPVGLHVQWLGHGKQARYIFRLDDRATEDEPLFEVIINEETVEDGDEKQYRVLITTQSDTLLRYFDPQEQKLRMMMESFDDDGDEDSHAEDRDDSSSDGTGDGMQHLELVFSGKYAERETGRLRTTLEAVKQIAAVPRSVTEPAMKSFREDFPGFDLLQAERGLSGELTVFKVPKGKIRFVFAGTGEMSYCDGPFNWTSILAFLSQGQKREEKDGAAKRLDLFSDKPQEIIVYHEDDKLSDDEEEWPSQLSEYSSEERESLSGMEEESAEDGEGGDDGGDANEREYSVGLEEEPSEDVGEGDHHHEGDAPLAEDQDQVRPPA